MDVSCAEGMPPFGIGNSQRNGLTSCWMSRKGSSFGGDCVHKGGGDCGQGASHPIAKNCGKMQENCEENAEKCGAVEISRSNTAAQGTHRAPTSTRGGQAKNNCGKMQENAENCEKLRTSIPPLPPGVRSTETQGRVLINRALNTMPRGTLSREQGPVTEATPQSRLAQPAAHMMHAQKMHVSER